MKILVTNDDGIEAAGIRTLVEHLSAQHELTVVAPRSERSGVGASLTLGGVLRTREARLDGAARAVAVEGNPVDCVKLAISTLLSRRPDLVISGINRGSNTGANVFYSGTVAAALEAALLGLPSLSVSLASFATDADFRWAAQVTHLMAGYVAEHGLPSRHWLNINVPWMNEEAPHGFRITRHGRARYRDRYECTGQDPSCYEIRGGTMVDVGTIESDEGAVARGWVSITPMCADFSTPLLDGGVTRWLQTRWRWMHDPLGEAPVRQPRLA